MASDSWRPPPFDREGPFRRGNLHCHSTRSDGALDPPEVVAAYKRLGYDFICLTDHFEAEYGWRLTDTTPWRDDVFTTLIGAELSSPGPVAPGKWWLAAVGLPLDFAPVADGESGPQLAERARAAGAFVALLHPGFNATRARDVDGLAALDAVEVYNDGVQRAHDRGDGWYLSVELLEKGRDVTAIASDDAHFAHGGLDALGGAWIQLRSRALDPSSLLAALKDGAFYASSGPQIHDVVLDGREVEVRCSPAATVALTGPGCLSRSVAARRWDGSPQRTGMLATVLEAQLAGITRCRLSLESPGDAATWGEWRPGDWWRVTVTDAAKARAWTSPSRLPA
jgi:hypothetical protein